MTVCLVPDNVSSFAKHTCTETWVYECFVIWLKRSSGPQLNIIHGNLGEARGFGVGQACQTVSLAQYLRRRYRIPRMLVIRVGEVPSLAQSQCSGTSAVLTGNITPDMLRSFLQVEAPLQRIPDPLA